MQESLQMKESDLDDNLNRDLIDFKVASKICDLESNWMKGRIPLNTIKVQMIDSSQLRRKNN